MKKPRGRPPTNFDKKAYQAQYMRDKRAAEKLGMTVKEYRATVSKKTIAKGKPVE